MQLSIDISDELSYEWLCLCINEFEEAALRSQSRAGLLAVARGSTQSADVILDSQERSLKRVSDTRTALHRNNEAKGEKEGIFSKILNSEANTQGVQLVDDDVDLNELFGGSDTRFANYLEECLGCSLRLKFDWQLQPLNLLLPINNFLDGLSAALDRLLSRIDPWKILQDICWALNQLKTLCPQDIIMVLMALKLLLKKYLLQMFSLKLDWTVLLGPLLKALLACITDLLDNLFQILMAPLDCLLNGLNAANDLLKATEEFAMSVQNSVSQVGDYFDKVGEEGFAKSLIDTEGSGITSKDISWTKPDPLFKADPLAYFNNGAGESPMAPGNQGYDPGRLNVQNTLDPIEGDAPETPEDALRVPSGFILKGQSMLDAIRDPAFVNSTWLDKIIIPVAEAVAWLRETYQKFIGSLNSLGLLVSGSLSLSIDNIGIILFILDMISLVMMIIKLLESNLSINDWCTFLKDNPQVLEEQLRSRFGNVNIDTVSRTDGDRDLVIKRGPNVLGTIKTCISDRTDSDNNVLKQWQAELEGLGVRDARLR